MRAVAVVILFLGLSAASCTQTVCSDESGSCGGASAADAGASADICSDPNAVSCDSQCVDTDVNPSYCGSCENECETGQGCSGGSCVDLCDPGQVNCDGRCIDPLSNGDFCGASGTCNQQDAGEDCGEDACSVGTCVSQRYVGSLQATTGRWNFGGVVGIPGAVEACRTLYAAPTAQVCTAAQLQQAADNGELINATDNAGTAVTSWYIMDAAQNDLQRQCVKVDGENTPWTYDTADLGQGSKYATLTAAAGTLSAVVDAPSAGDSGCRAQRSVACCLP